MAVAMWIASKDRIVDGPSSPAYGYLDRLALLNLTQLTQTVLQLTDPHPEHGLIVASTEGTQGRNVALGAGALQPTVPWPLAGLVDHSSGRGCRRLQQRSGRVDRRAHPQRQADGIGRSSVQDLLTVA